MSTNDILKTLNLLNWKQDLFRQLNWKQDLFQHLDWKQDLFHHKGIIGAMDEQSRLWEKVRPIRGLHGDLDTVSRLTRGFEGVRGISSVVASAMEDYNLKFNSNLSLIRPSLLSLLPENRYGIDGICGRLSGIHGLESRYRGLLDAVDVDCVLPSQRIINSLASIAAACTVPDLGSKYASINLYASLPYNDFVYKQLKKIEIDTPCVATRRAVVTELCGEVYDKSNKVAEMACAIAPTDEPSFVITSSNKVANVFGAINCHLGYIYNPNKEYDLESEFDANLPIQINNLGCYIIELIYNINDLSCKKGRQTVFSVTNKALIAASRVSTTIAVNESLFGDIIDNLYFLLYEGSGTGSRITEIVDKETLNPVWNVKFLRNDFRHDIDHGSHNKISDKFVKVAGVYKSLIGSERPRSNKEWLHTQLILYKQIADVLCIIHKKQ